MIRLEQDASCCTDKPSRDWCIRGGAAETETRAELLRTRDYEGRSYNYMSVLCNVRVSAPSQIDEYVSLVSIPFDAGLTEWYCIKASALPEHLCPASKPGIGLVSQVDGDILESESCAREAGEELPSWPARLQCQSVARLIEQRVTVDDPVKVAAFGADGGGILLIADSLPHKRRVSFEISADVRQILVDKIDEHARLTTSCVAIDDVYRVREAISWLLDR